MADGIYQKMRQGLETDDVWGKAAAFQRDLNGGTTDFLGVQRKFRQAWTTDYGRSEYNTWLDKEVADPGKVEALLRGIRDPSKDLGKQSALDWLSGQERRATALLEHGGSSLPAAQRKAAESLLSKAKSFRAKLDQSVTRAAEKHQFDLLTGHGGSGALLGGLVGGGVASGSPLGVIAAGLAAVSNPAAIAGQMHAIESLAAAAHRTIGGHLSSTFSKGAFGGAAYQIARLTGAATREGDSYDRRAAALRVEAQRLRTQSAKSAAIATAYQLHQAVPNAPGTIAAASATAERAQGYLASHIPSMAPEHALGPVPRPAPSEVTRYERLKNAIDDPPGVVAHVADGTVSPDEVAAIAAVHPAQYADIVDDTTRRMAKLREQGKTLPYAERLSLGTLVPGAEPTLEPAFIAAMQDLYAQQPVAPPPAMRATSAQPMKHLSLNEGLEE